MDKFAQIFLIFLLLSSCGVKKNNKTGQVSQTNFLIESYCSPDENLRSLRIKQSVLSLQNDVSNLKIGIINLEVKQVEGSSYRTPLDLSISLFEFEYREIVKELEENIGKNWKSQENFSIEDRRYIFKILENIKFLISKIERWEAHQCNLEKLLEKEEDDFSYFLIVKDQCSSDECNNKIEDVLKLCSQFISRSLCETELSLHRSKGSSKRFVKHYFEKAQKKYNRIFSITPKLKFKCDHNSISVNIFFSPDFKSVHSREHRAQMLRFLSEKWGQHNLNFHFKEVETIQDRNTIIIKFAASGLSYVEDIHPNVIHIGKNLRDVYLRQVLTHEMGHSLGFKDCYIEFFSRESKTVRYYSLSEDDSNFMCHIHKEMNIPASYIEQIQEKLCF